MLRRLVLVFLLALVALGCGSAPRAAEGPKPDVPAPGLGAEPAPVYVTSTNELASPDHGAAPVPVTDADPTWGDALAPVTIVEFSDFECPFCSRVNPTLAEVKRTYGPARVRIVWKHNPLPFHKRAHAAAVAAQVVFALGGSGAFFRFHDDAFAHQKELTPENFEKWAIRAGVDLERFREGVASKRFSEKVDADIALAKRVGALGTPGFRINGVTLSGAQPFEKFKELIDSELAEAKKLVDAGTSRADVYVVLTKRNYKEPALGKQARDDDEDLGIWNVPVLPDDPVRGPRDALVTIVEFSEFQCPFCKRVKPTLDELLSAYPKDVRLVWKDNPLPFHPRARPSAVLARHAFQKGGNDVFWKVHDALFESQPKLEDEDLRRVAEGAGLVWKPIALAIEKDKSPKLDASVELASDFAARGTPHFFINGVRLAGAQPRDRFEERIRAALEVARTLVEQGVPRAKIYETVTKNGRLPPPPERKDVPAPDARTPFRGDPLAPVVIQIFSDFQCPFCKRVPPTLAELATTYGSKVSFAWRHLPLPFHQDAPLAAEAAEEAFAQRGSAGFWRYHDALFEAQPTGIGRDVLESIGARLGLDMPRFRTALDERKHRPKVEADAKIAKAAGINGTPAFVINGYFLSGAQPAPAFKKLITRALEDRKKR
jgi:protein-disulfide isomerase